MIVDLAYVPRAWQEECHTQKQRFNVLALHRRAGKTELALRDLIDAALRNTLELPFYVYVAPFLKQAKAIAWARLKLILAPLRRLGFVEVNESELSVRLTLNGAVIRLFGADNPDAMRGLRLDGAVLDEVAQMRPEVWDDIIQPALSDRLGWATFIGTPNGVNLFSELFFMALATQGWRAARYTVYDTNAIAETEVARLRATMSEASFAREYLCDFDAAGEDQLISLTDLDLACRRVLGSEDWQYAARVIGVDPARFGSDRSVIYRRQGLNGTFPPIVMQGRDNMAVADRLSSVADQWKPDAIFIDEGNGAGVIDRMRQLGYAVIGVHFGGKAEEARFVNKRTEMWFRVKEWVESGGVLPDHPALRADLATPRYSFNRSTDKIELETKDEIKERIKRSPDLGDGLALTFAHPVQADHSPKAELIERHRPQSNAEAARRQVLDYNPIG